jgi:hypothetical protein
MIGPRKFLTGMLLVGAMTLVAHSKEARATDQPLHGIWLACDNGRNYPVRPVAVSDEGDLVTGYIVVGRHRNVHIRLIPMGEGYRYAGLGIWFDGLGGDAVLNWGRPGAVPCTVQQG